MFGEEGSVMAKVRTEAKGSRDLLIANLLGKPELSTSEISKIVGCSQSIVRRVAKGVRKESFCIGRQLRSTTRSF